MIYQIEYIYQSQSTNILKSHIFYYVKFRIEHIELISILDKDLQYILWGLPVHHMASIIGIRSWNQ